ncbi:thiosulfate oxidation carrier complex protein SoxZ [Methylotenera sp.]|uniref:thiosulfate oxidation carrier complex protein SoxZ n=1 Tax=Methylotenera sp. TaxID=2051956 RepID=UPI002715C47E|nr:thiosulfate oxidation carrier complex protein SoxZ [Methylotenera sp.]MDO9205085.1 thiosulfate oxidation carrier complex protein SoxZ [Methylotenera sp.]MDP2231911.1 thiosulfate oxidation carrier complex protein SoxZ [Methylotenera sp.]MDP3141010.1 thiosulfate oxidation carrier complex protein SoxZ [Methylotenera sp.]MDP3308886.1 thiosulfate oxidation carrier complex protein SoxZ [Methylotenera sp.]MDP3819009.1 thiosulfate oxidation carrier complex protein SoxZ [Methylotenera sp.]
MASDNMKMRAQLKGEVTEIKVLMSHPMETGRKKDDFDQLIPAHFVQLLTATLNGQTVLEAQWGTGISKNPYLTFRLKGAKVGDTVAVTWLDNLGKTATQDITVTQA